MPTSCSTCSTNPSSTSRSSPIGSPGSTRTERAPTPAPTRAARTDHPGRLAIGNLIDTIARHWTAELSPEESLVSFHPDIRVGNHPCTMIETVHPKKQPNYLFHMVKVYIDHEHGLPIRFEAYDWPKHAGAAPVLVEEYSYLNLRVNVGLRDHDFDPANKQYSFGRF